MTGKHSISGWRDSTALCTRALAGAMALALLPGMAQASPLGGTVSAGQAAIAQQGTATTITQSSNRAVIDWRSFNVGTNESVNFAQPSASSLTLNRINDANPSQILGSIAANGQIVLVNPNGVFFGTNSKIDVAGLIASTANISNSDFMAGNMNFSQPGNPNAAIVNQGAITAGQAGLVGFIAPHVENDGVITAKLGKVTLASGDTATLDMAGDNLITIAVTGNLPGQTVTNTGTIAADGGTVTLTAAAARGIVDSLISNSGIIQANAVGQQGGSVILYAQGSNAVPGNVAANKGQLQGTSTVLNSGTITASGSGSGQTGGSISVLGDHVGLLSGSTIDASGDAGGGTIQIGGDFHGQGNTPTASATVVQSGSLIKANALTSGNGGNVTFWSDDYTDFAGTIEAKGGATSGNGGFVETSGKQTLSMQGIVDASAPNGNAGTWLMDPNNLIVNGSSTSNAGSSPNWTAASGGGNVLNTDINTALNGGTSVDLTASGSIEVAANISKTAGTDASLTLAAGTDITVDSSVAISSTTGKLNVIFDADTALAGGAIVMNTGSSITSNGGNITMGGGANPLTTAAIGDATNIIGVNLNDATLSAAGGAITITGTGYGGGTNTANANGIEMQAGATASTTGNGTITLNGTGGGTGSGATNFGVDLSGTSNNTQLTVVNGNLSITGTGGVGSGLGDRGVEIDTSLVQTTGIGAIAITGIGGGSGGGISGYGVNQSGTVSSTATGGGGITIIGYGGDNGGSGFANYGIQLSNSVTSVDGNIIIDGNTGINGRTVSNPSGNNGSYPNQGIWLYDGQVTSTGNATITLNGVGDASGGSSNIYGVQISGSTVTSVNGNITINGTGGSTSGGADFGINLNSSPQIYTTGTGTISMTGVGGNNASGISSASGSIIGNISDNGNITLIADTLSLSTATIKSLQDVTFAPYTASTTIGVNGGSGTLQITSGILSDVTAGSVTIGSTSDIGPMAITGGGTYSVPTTFANGLGLTTWTGNSYDSNIGFDSLGSVVIVPSSAGTTIAVGSGASGSLAVNNANLGNITAGTLVFGSTATTGAIDIAAETWGKNISFVNSGSGTITVDGAQTVNAGYSMSFQTDITPTLNHTIAGSATGGINFLPATNATTLGIAGGAGTLNFGTVFLSDISGFGSYGFGSLTGTGAITADAYGWGGNNLSLTSQSGVITMAAGATTVKNLTIQTDANPVIGSTITGSGALLIEPTTASTTMEIGGSTKTIDITNGELTNLGTGWTGIGFGSTAQTGTMTVDAETWSDPLTLKTGSGIATIAGAQALGANNFTLETNATPVFSSTITTTGAATVETSGATTLGVGTHAFGTVNLTDTMIGNLTAGSYIFGSTATGNLDINTGSAIANQNLTFISGGSINLDKSGDTSPTALTKSAGGTTTLTLEAGTDITINNSITASGGGNLLNVVLDSDTGLAGGAIVMNSGSIITSNGGNITLGGGALSGGLPSGAAIGDSGYSNDGIGISGQLQAGGGNISLSGDGYTATDNAYSQGVSIGNKIQTIGSGTISITGIGGSYAASPGSYWDFGVYIGGVNGLVSTVNGNIMIHGTTLGPSSMGVLMQGGGEVQSTGSGNISLYGSNTGSGEGLYLSGSSIVSTNSGSITATGVAANYNGGTDIGIIMDGWGGSAVGIVESTSGNITMNGTGGSATGGANWGIYSGGGTIETGGAGSITLNGTGGTGGSADYGIYLIGAPIHVSGTGTISISGTGAAGTGSSDYGVYVANASTINSVSGALNITGIAGESGTAGIATVTGSNVIGGGSETGNITLIADNVSLANLSVQTSGNITAKEYTSGTTIGIGSGTGSLSWTDTEIGYLNGGSYTFGDANAGAMDINTALTYSVPVTFQTGGNITLDHALVSSASVNAITLASGENFINTAGASALTPGTGRYLIYSTNPANNMLDGLSDASDHIFNKTYAGYAPGSVTQSGDLFLYSLAPTITVTANNASRLYGAANPTFTAGYTGFIDGDAASILSGAPSLTTPATVTTGVGSYGITAAAGSLADSLGYQFSYTNGTLTVNKAHLSVTANNASRLYGASDPAFTDTITGFVNGQNSSVVSGNASNTTPAGDTAASAAASSYSITPTQGSLSASNYDFTTFNTGTLTVNKAPLLVTADSGKTMVYGASSLPTLTDTITGYVNGQNATSAGITGAPTLTTTATTYNGTAGSGSNVGTYAIDAAAGNLSAANYSFTYANATNGLTVTPATLTVTANNQSRLYGAANPAFTEAVTGYQNGDTASILTGSATGSSTAATTTSIGSYSITGSNGTLGVNDGDYSFAAPVNGTLTINKAPLLVTADGGKAMVYGASSLPTLTDTITGYVNGQNATSAAITGAPTLTTTATAYNGTAGSGSNVGTYNINASAGNLSAANYSFTYANAPNSLTVTPATLTVTANNQSRPYGAANPAFTEAVTGYQNGDTASILTGSATGSSTTSLTSGAGASYTITASNGTFGVNDGDYRFAAPVNGTLIISKASLLVTANDAARPQGTPNPLFTASYSGLRNGDAASLIGGLQFTTPATPASSMGLYAIIPFGASAANYALSYADGVLTVGNGVLPSTVQATIDLRTLISQLRPVDSTQLSPPQALQAPIYVESALFTSFGLDANDPNRWWHGVIPSAVSHP